MAKQMSEYAKERQELDRLRRYFGDSETADIGEMHRKFKMTYSLHPNSLDIDTLMGRAEFLREELEELLQSIQQKNYLEVIDALVDIVVVAKGTAVMLGLRWDLHWNEVLRANMSKERGNNPKRPGMKEDLIKPEGWVGPDHLRVLDRYR